ncbi:MFS transporter [Bifidobacterium sp.]|uniref:MFS transporter n=1 Tax=Bifidobacterium sp. TaxID=41200 RepID=UPI0039EB2728
MKASSTQASEWPTSRIRHASQAEHGVGHSDAVGAIDRKRIEYQRLQGSFRHHHRHDERNEESMSQHGSRPIPDKSMASERLSRNWPSLTVLLLGVAMSMLDTTIVNVALPTIRVNLHASESVLSWVVSGYALAFGLALIPAGRLGDRFGHKWVFTIGLAGFTLASLWCAISDSSLSLVCARIVQGLFGGVFYPAVTALIQLLFVRKTRSRAFSVMGAVIGFSTAIGPVLGGFLIEWFGQSEGWRSVFYVNLPFGIIAVIGSIITLPSAVSGRTHGKADVVGLILMTCSLSAILVPLIQGEGSGWPLWTWLMMCAGVLLLVAFGLWQMRLARLGAVPLIPPKLFVRAQFTGGIILALVYFAAFTSIFFTLSLLWQSGLGHSALETGYMSAPFAIGSIIGASQSHRLAYGLGRKVLSIGTGMVAFGLLSVWLMLSLLPTGELNNWVLLLPLLIAGIGSGFFIAPNVDFIVATVDRADAGAASGIVGTAQRVGAASGIAIIGSILFGSLDFPHRRITSQILADTFTHAASVAMLASAMLAVIACLLVFALPKSIQH